MAAKKKTIEDMLQMARKRGGTCLSQQYVNCITKIKWQCKKGHQWETAPKNIQKGAWCPECGIASRRTKLLRYTIKDMQQMARKRGGTCLSKQYVNGTTIIKWQCEKKHRWEAAPYKIQQGIWCPECGTETKRTKLRRYAIKVMQQMASERGGVCISKKYIDSTTKIKWQCKKGHQWTAIPRNIKQGRWCPVCANDALRHRALEDMRQIARKHVGKCLSKQYIDSTTKLKWQCKKGHQWTATPRNIKQGRWCPVCARDALRHRALDDMQQIARKRGGTCLSTQYVNGLTKIKWQCKKGHQWEALPYSIQSGAWCPECYKETKRTKLLRYTIDDMQRIAHVRGGKCLSKRYINVKIKLKWQCKEGHQWAAPLNNIRQGLWCPACSRDENSYQKLTWQCEAGHTWQATYITANKTWCPICRTEKTATLYAEVYS